MDIAMDKGKHVRTFEEKLGTGEIEVSIVITRKDRSIRRTQEYKFKGKKDERGKSIMVLKHREVKDFPGEGKNG